MAWQATKRVSPRIQVRTVYGSMLIRMDPRFGSVSNIVYFGDRFDPDEMDFMARYLRAGDRFLDVGANIGTYTLLAASLIGPTGMIDAVEAVPNLASGLRANIALNHLEDSVRVHEAAASDHPGSVRFRIDRDVTSRMAIESDPHETVRVVPCAPLDDLVPAGPIALGKIDVEGSEVAVLRGMTDRLQASDPAVLLLEILPHQLKRQGQSVEVLLDVLNEHEFVLASYSADHPTLTKRSDHDWDGNVLAVSRGSFDAVNERLAESTLSDGR